MSSEKNPPSYCYVLVFMRGFRFRCTVLTEFLTQQIITGMLVFGLSGGESNCFPLEFVMVVASVFAKS